MAYKLPAVIRTAAENRRMLAGIEEFDRGRHELAGSTPDGILRGLMEEHGLRQRDLLDVFGSSGVASEVAGGKRAISEAQARKLAARYHVPADLFL